MAAPDKQSELPATPRPGELLFAYGTLKRGGEYQHLLQSNGTVFVACGRLLTPYPLLLAQYPCLLDQPGRGYQVNGELFRISSKAVWTAVDQLEDHPREYLRRVETVETSGGMLRAWTYFYQMPDSLDAGLEPVEGFST